MATATAAAEGLDRRFDFESTRTETGVTWPNLINTSSPSSVRETKRKGVEAGEKSKKERRKEKRKRKGEGGERREEKRKKGGRKGK